jgi:tetratricopeptide (TPR) repeat protein
VCLLFIIIGFAIISAFDFPKERFPHLIYWGIVLAFLISLNAPFTKRIRLPSQIAVIGHCLILLIATLSLWLGYVRVNGDIHMVNVFRYRQRGSWEQLVSEVNVINTRFYSVDHTSTPVQWYRGVANFSLNRIQDALNDFNKAYKVHPYHIHVLNNLGSCYESLGEHSQAERFYLKALDISPVFDEALINLAVVYYNLKKYKRSYETIIRTNPASKDTRRELYLKAIKDKLQPTD